MSILSLTYKPVFSIVSPFNSTSNFFINEERIVHMHKIAVIPGDGTGPEVVNEALKVLNAASVKFGFKYETTTFDFGGERYKKTGETLPDSAVDELRKFNAILLGAIGHPDVTPGILEKGILLKARFELDQYINLRPIRLYPGVETPLKDKGPKDIDYCVIRENTGDQYTGVGGVTMKGTPHEVAIQTAVYSRFQVDRCLRYAFEYTRKYGKKATRQGRAQHPGPGRKDKRPDISLRPLGPGVS